MLTLMYNMPKHSWQLQKCTRNFRLNGHSSHLKESSFNVRILQQRIAATFCLFTHDLPPISVPPLLLDCWRPEPGTVEVEGEVDRVEVIAQ